jgi:hypothetical protein
MLEIRIELKLSIGEETYIISDSIDCEPDCANSHASNLVDVIAMKLQGALEPCYWDHSVTNGIQIADHFKGEKDADN